MKQLFIRGSLLALLALVVNKQAQAHIHYFDITNTGAAGHWDQFSAYGWQQGQIQVGTSAPQGSLATTDDVNWYSFTLTQASDVTLKFASSPVTGGAAGLSALGLSLYSGLFVDNSFDVNLLIPLAAGQRGLVNTAQSFSMTTDTPNLTIAQHDLRTINFIADATDGGTGTAQLANVLLGPGSYSVIASGNNPWTVAEAGLAQYGATISFAATPAAVPVPGAFWLMSSALGALGLFGRRKNQLAA